MKEIPLRGFGPDDPVTPGFFSTGQGYEFTTRGLKVQRKLTTVATSVLSGAKDGAVHVLPGGTTAIHLGGGLNLFRVSGGSVVDANRAAAYNASSDMWSFAQWGNYVFATNRYDTVQVRDATGTSAFADSAATAIPKAKIAVSWGPPSLPMLMLLAYDDGTYHPSSFWNSNEGGPLTDWTADVATGAYNNDLLTQELTAGIGFRDQILIWNNRETYLGTWVGPGASNGYGGSSVAIQRIADDVGCVGMYACCTMNGVAYFVGPQGLYVFDGSYPRKMPLPIQDWIANQMVNTSTDAKRTQLVADGTRQRLILNVRDSSANILYSLSIHLLTNRVGQLYVSGRKGAMSRQYWFDGGNVYVESTSPEVTNLIIGGFFGMNPVGDMDGDTQWDRIFFRFSDTYRNPPASVDCYHYVSASPQSSSSVTPVNVAAEPWRADLLANPTAGKWHTVAIGLYASTVPAKDPELVSIAVPDDQPRPRGRS